MYDGNSKCVPHVYGVIKNTVVVYVPSYDDRPWLLIHSNVYSLEMLTRRIIHIILDSIIV